LASNRHPGYAGDVDAPPLSDPDRMLALAYASARARDAMACFLAYDEALGRAVAASREPMIGRITLAWWCEQVEALDTRAPQGEPLLEAMHRTLPGQVDLVRAASIADAWSILLDEETLSPAALTRFAHGRGGALFALCLDVAGTRPGADAEAAGEGWALADFARHCGDPALAAFAREAAAAAFARCRLSSLPASLRVLAGLGRHDVTRGPVAPERPGAPRRMARALRLALLAR
jgi:15-cis-phytoene synthase